MPTLYLLLQELADGRFHSGQQLAHAMGQSRAAVWKNIRKLQADFGLTVHAVRGRGYRLAAPLELLDSARIHGRLDAASKDTLEALHLLSSAASTNSCALSDLPAKSGTARVWVAEHQTAGRGRRGRTWVSSYGANLYLSLAWRFDLPMAELTGLSLAAGVVVAEALQHLGVERHVLKWPNDIMVDGCKLSGILVDVSGEAGGPATAVIGVGVNVRMPIEHGVQIEQPWTDLSRISAVPISRNDLAGIIVDRLIGACRLFAEQRLAPFLGRWERFDKLHGEDVLLIRGDRVICGVYRGISPSGAMLLENAGGLSEHFAGEVSLRMVANA